MVVLRTRRTRWWGGALAAVAAALAVLGVRVAGPVRWLAELTAATLVVHAWAQWRSAVLCGPAGVVLREGLGSRFVPWRAIAHVEARRIHGWPGLQVVLDLQDGGQQHLRAISGGVVIDRVRAPANLAGWLALHLAWAAAGEPLRHTGVR
jgi:hypothetical protein